MFLYDLFLDLCDVISVLLHSICNDFDFGSILHLEKNKLLRSYLQERYLSTDGKDDFVRLLPTIRYHDMMLSIMFVTDYCWKKKLSPARSVWHAISIFLFGRYQTCNADPMKMSCLTKMVDAFFVIFSCFTKMHFSNNLLSLIVFTPKFWKRSMEGLLEVFERSILLETLFLGCWLRCSDYFNNYK